MITVDRKTFSRAIDFAAKSIGRRSKIPVLTMMKVTANGALTLEGTDLDYHTRVEMPYDGDEGEFMLPEPRRVRSAINVAGGQTVSITARDAENDRRGLRLAVSAGQFDGDLISSISADDFPTCAGVHYEDFTADLGAAELKQLARIVPAISSEDTRYYLNGVCVKKVGDWLYQFCATDGHRMMIVDIPLPNATGEIPDGTIIPHGWLNIALASFTKAKEGSKLVYGRSQVKNHSEGTQLPVDTPGGPRIAIGALMDGMQFTLTGKLIDGTYPDYTRVIPAEIGFAARMKRADLAQAVNALTPMSGERTRAIKLSLSRPGEAMVTLNSPETGDHRFTLPCEHGAPADFFIGFNAQYLLDAIGSLTGDEIELGLTDAASPVMVTDPADTAFRAVQMPMRV